MSIQTEIFVPDLKVKDGIVELTATATGVELEESNQSNIATYSSENLIYQRSADGTYYIVTGVKDGITYVSIPPVWEGAAVKAISGGAFRGNTDIQEVIIPSSVKTIGLQAFHECDHLKKVTITGGGSRYVYFRNTLNWVDPYVCELVDTDGWNIKKGVYVGKGDDGAYIYRYEIDAKTFELFFCDYNTFTPSAGLLDENLTKSTEIHSYDAINFGCYECYEHTTKNTYRVRACESRSTMVEQDMESKAVSIGDGAFIGTDISSFNIPETIREIPDSAFEGVASLKSLTFSEFSGLKKIGMSAFAESKLSNELVLPKSLVEIGKYAFENCSSLTSVYASGILKIIGDYAFKGCYSLEDVTLGSGSNSLEKIGLHAFEYCSKLKKVGELGVVPLLPSSLWFIGMNAFKDCASLEPHKLADRYGWLYTSGNVSDDRTSDADTNPFSSAVLMDNEAVKTILKTTHVNYNLFKIDKLPAPTILIQGATLRITDSSGHAKAFKIFVDGTHWATANVDGGFEIVG